MFAQFALQARLIFRQLWPFLRSHKKLGLISFIIITSAIITSWFVFAPFAQAGWLSGVGETIGKAFAGLLFLLAGFCIKLTFFVLKFIIEVAGYNGFIDSPAVTVGWVMIRDLTNMFFVVVLLMIAFGTILGLDHYEWKHMLFKLVTAAVLVNFSRLICGLIIDVAQIVMVTFLNGIAATASGNLVNMFQVDKIFKLGNGDNFTGDTPSIFIASVAAIMFSVTMLITMLAFLFMIVARMAMLWVLIVVSPFAFVLNVLHQTEHFAGEWWGKFNSNVVSGPVIAFFLWLSFVTVGSGNIHDDIVKHNSLKQGQLLQESAAPAEEQTGITEVMSWENMGNFIIAIAILMAGAKMAEELGVAGAHMMGSASELGKKAAIYASGFKAAKWAAPKIAMNMPFGGKFWQRQGTKIAGYAGYKWGRLNERRNEAAVGLEKDRKKFAELDKKAKAGTLTDEKEIEEYQKLSSNKGALKRAGKLLLSRLIEPSGRADKRSKDWKTAAEIQHEIVEETYSVSSEPGGVAKVNAGRRMHNMEELAEAKKHLKEAKEESRLRSRAKMTELDHEIHKTKDPSKKEILQKERDELWQDHKEKFSEIFEGPDFYDEKYAARMENAEKTHASSDIIAKDIAKEKELELAKFKDKELKKKGEFPRFEAAVRAAQQKDLEDQMSGLTYRELTERSLIFAQQMSKKLADNPEYSTSKEYRQQSANAAAAMSASVRKGSEFGSAAIDKAAEGAGFAEDIKAGDMEAMQRKILSGLLGKYVDGATYSLGDAIRDFTKIHGEQTSVILRNLNESLKGTAKDGAPNVAGLINDVDLEQKDGKSTGRVIFRFTGFDEKGDRVGGEQKKRDQQYFEGQRQYYAQEAVISKITGLSDLLSRTSTGALATPIDQQGINQFIAAFSSMTRATKLHSRLVEQLNGLLKKDDAGKPVSEFASKDLKENFQKLFSTFLSSNREAAKSVLGKLGIFASAVAEGNQEIASALKEVSKEVRNNSAKLEESHGSEESGE